MKISNPILEMELTHEEFKLITKFVCYLNTILYCTIVISVVERDDEKLKCKCIIEH